MVSHSQTRGVVRTKKSKLKLNHHIHRCTMPKCKYQNSLTNSSSSTNFIAMQVLNKTSGPEQICLQFCPVLKPCVSVADAFFNWKKWPDTFPHPLAVLKLAKRYTGSRMFETSQRVPFCVVWKLLKGVFCPLL